MDNVQLATHVVKLLESSTGTYGEVVPFVRTTSQSSSVCRQYTTPVLPFSSAEEEEEAFRNEEATEELAMIWAVCFSAGHHACMSACMQAHTYMHTHTHIHTHTQTHTHLHIHTQTHILVCLETRCVSRHQLNLKGMQIIECNFHMHYDQKQYTEDKLSQTTLFI